MEAVRTSETSTSLCHTSRHNIPEDSHLHTRRRETLESHLIGIACVLYKMQHTNGWRERGMTSVSFSYKYRRTRRNSDPRQREGDSKLCLTQVDR
jgi:hypothetical protein